MFKNKDEFQGFSLVELLISLSILVIVAAVAFLNLVGYRSFQDLDLTLEEILMVLKETQNRNITQQDGLRWSVRFDNGDNCYKVFKGLNYQPEFIDRIYCLRRGIRLSEPYLGSFFDVFFEPLTGRLPSSKIISLVGAKEEGLNLIGEIIINKFGLMNKNIEKSLSGYWHLDEGLSDRIYDATLRNNDGVFIDRVDWGSEDDCLFGKCLSFSSVGYVEIRDPFSNNKDFTISLWVKPKFYEAYYLGIIGGEDEGVCSKPSLWLDTSMARLDLVYDSYDKSCTTQFSAVLENFFNEGYDKWYFLVWVKKDSNYYFYRNGEFIGTKPAPFYFYQSNSSYWFGKASVANGWYSYWQGFIDEIKIYNQALSQEEIRNLFK